MVAGRSVLAGEENLFAFDLVFELDLKLVLLLAKLTSSKQWLLLV